MQRPPKSVRDRAIWLSFRLNSRDVAILETIGRLQLATGSQIERLHFADLKAAFRVRARVLARLTSWRALVTVGRWVGGHGGGAGQQVYRLDRAAALLVASQRRSGPVGRSPGERLPSWLRGHVLEVSELYVRLVEASRTAGFTVSDYRAEPESWWEPLRPDAYAALRGARFSDHWWIEVDRATESTATVQDKLAEYLRFAESGENGPADCIPRVLVTAPDLSRRSALRKCLAKLPTPAADLIHVTAFEDAVTLLTEPFTSTEERKPS